MGTKTGEGNRSKTHPRAWNRSPSFLDWVHGKMLSNWMNVAGGIELEKTSQGLLLHMSVKASTMVEKFVEINWLSIKGVSPGFLLLGRTR